MAVTILLGEAVTLLIHSCKQIYMAVTILLGEAVTLLIHSCKQICGTPHGVVAFIANARLELVYPRTLTRRLNVSL